MLLNIAISFVLGSIIAWIIAQSLGQSHTKEERQRADRLQADLLLQAAALDELQQEREKARERDATYREEIARLQTTLEVGQKSEEMMEDRFEVLANQILEEKAKRFTDQNQENLGNLLKPLGEALGKLQSTTHELEVKREGAYGTVLTEIRNIQETHVSLRRETTQLIQALRAPKARGNWGELQLKRCIEFAGMVEHASFDVEVFVRGEDVSVRPDCVIHLPNERTIVIDVKTPFDAFLDAMSSTDEATRETRLVAHAARVREHLSQLSAKAYWKQFKDSPDFVVCFLSSEVLFSAALEQDPGLIEFGSNSNVILATPTTLIALLKAVAYGWQQMEVTRNAIAIREAGEKLYDKLTTAQDYFNKMGKALAGAVGQYNSLVGCIEGGRGALAQARRLHELGIGQEELAETRLLDPNVRDLREADWSRSESLFIAAEVEDDS